MPSQLFDLKVNPPRRGALGLLILWASISGCATTQVELHPHESSSGDWQGTALLLDYSLETTDPETLKAGCALTLTNTSQGKDYVFQLPGGNADKRSLLIDVPPGVYSGKKLACPHFAKWDLISFVRGDFTIEPDRINYLGRVTFHFSQEGAPLKIVTSEQTAVTRGLRSDIGSWPESWKSSIVDPFTRKPITPAMIPEKSEYRMDIHARKFVLAGEKPSSTTELDNQLKACDLTEQKKYPYRVGTLSWRAHYDDRQLKDLKKEGVNAFSAGFLDCLEQALRGFKPETASRLEVTVTI